MNCLYELPGNTGFAIFTRQLPDSEIDDWIFLDPEVDGESLNEEKCIWTGCYLIEKCSVYSEKGRTEI